MAPPPPPPPAAGGYPSAPPPPSGPGGYQTYQPGPEGRVIPEIGAYQDEPWKRLVARIIDGVILAIPNFILASILLTVNLNDCTFGNLDGCRISVVDYFMYGLIALVLNGAYYIGFVAFMGTTPGKMAFGLKIVQKNGQAPDIAVAVRRWIIDGGTSALALIPIGAGRWLSTVAVIGIGVYQLTLLFSDPRQEDLYDKLGDTYVVKK